MFSKAVIISFVLSIVLNILLPTTDVYSDLGTAWATLTFTGLGLQLAGCRACYHKDEETVYRSKTGCQQCLLTNKKFVCGHSIETLTRIQELQEQDTCMNETWRYYINDTSFETNLVEGKCNETYDQCCIQNTNDPPKDDVFSFIKNKRILAYRHSKKLSIPMTEVYFNAFYDFFDDAAWKNGTKDFDYFSDYYISYQLYGNATVPYCNRIFNLNDIDQIGDDLFLKNFIKTVGYRGQYLEWRLSNGDENFKQFLVNNSYPLNTFKTIDMTININENKTANKLGYAFNYQFNHGCGAAFIPMDLSYYQTYPKLPPSPIHNGETCGNDVCLVHLQYLKKVSPIVDFKTWKSTTYQSVFGKNLGGETCRVLRIYGFISLIAPLVHLLFNVMHYRKDFKEGDADYFDIIPLLCFIYPQWKSVKILLAYIDHRNEDRLQHDKDKFDCNLGTLEPFLEAAIQVSKLNHLFFFFQLIKCYDNILRNF